MVQMKLSFIKNSPSLRQLNEQIKFFEKQQKNQNVFQIQQLKNSEGINAVEFIKRMHQMQQDSEKRKQWQQQELKKKQKLELQKKQQSEYERIQNLNIEKRKAISEHLERIKQQKKQRDLILQNSKLLNLKLNSCKQTSFNDSNDYNQMECYQIELEKQKNTHQYHSVDGKKDNQIILPRIEDSKKKKQLAGLMHKEQQDGLGAIVPVILQKSKMYEIIKNEDRSLRKQYKKKLENLRNSLHRRQEYGKVLFNQIKKDNSFAKNDFKQQPYIFKTETEKHMESKKDFNFDKQVNQNLFSKQEIFVSKNIQTANRSKLINKMTEPYKAECKKRIQKYQQIDLQMQQDTQERYLKNQNPISARFKNYLDVKCFSSKQEPACQILCNKVEFEKILSGKKKSEEKYQFLKQNTNLIESKAKIKEEIHQLANQNQELAIQDQIDNLYLESIKTKLLFLDKIQKQ